MLRLHRQKTTEDSVWNGVHTCNTSIVLIETIFFFIFLGLNDAPSPFAVIQFYPERETENLFRVCTLICTITSNLFKDTLCRYEKPTRLWFEDDFKFVTDTHDDEKNILIFKGMSYRLKEDEVLFCYNHLRNNCGIPQHKNGWGFPPETDDHSLAACIDRIMIQRNAIADSMKFGLSDSVFQKILCKLRDDIFEIEQQVIGGKEYKEKVDVFLATSVDQLFAVHYVGKRNMFSVGFL